MSLLQDKQARRGLITFLLFAVLAVMSFKTVIPKLLSGEERERVTAQFVDTGQLKVGDPVRIDGVKVGRVDDISRAADRTRTVVQMSVDEEALPLNRDAGAKVAMRGLLAGTFYIDLDPGTRGAGRLASATLDPSRTSGQMELEDFTSIFKGDEARAGLRALPGEFAEALSDPNLPAAPVEVLADVSPKLSEALRGIRGEELDTDLKQLVRASAKTARNFDAPRDRLRTLVSGAAATLQTTAFRASDLRFIFQQSPAIQQRVRAQLDRLDDTLEGARPLLRALKEPAKDLQPTLAGFRQPITDTDELLRAAVPLLRSLRPASRATVGAARSGDPALDGLDVSFERLADQILPYFNKTQEETQLTPAQAVGPFFSSWGGAAAQVDSNGHMFRFPASGGDGMFSNDTFCRSHLNNPTAPALITCDKFADAIKALFVDPMKGPPGTEPPGDQTPTRKKR